MELAFNRTRFMCSASTLAECPPEAGHEVAFCGRSNAGKSSAINALTNNRKLARISKTPGRTQLLNFFHVDEGFRLVDLPGYGYAKAPEALRTHWAKHLDHYLTARSSLVGIVLVMDARHPLRDFDRMMIDWCGDSDHMLHVLLTKADKLKRNRQVTQMRLVENYLEGASSSHGPPLSVQLFSATRKHGVEEFRQLLSDWARPKKSPDHRLGRE